MAGTKKCPKCGLMQMARPQCKKCGAPLSTTDGTRHAVSPAPSTASTPSMSNPYAPPETEFTSPMGGGESGNVWRDGQFLVAAKFAAALPNRCVKCNRATTFKLKRKYYWHPQAWYLLIFLNVLIYAIAALIVRKTAEVQVGLCDDHQRRRKIFMLIGALLPFLGIGSCIVAGHSEDFIMVGMGATVLGIIWLVIASQLLRAHHIDENVIRLKGVCSEYLSNLPPYLSARS